MPPSDTTAIHLLWYTAADLEEKTLAAPEDALPYLQREGVTWVHVQGLGDVAKIQQVSEVFKLHPLALEDVLSAQQRPKAEEYEDMDFVVTYHVAEGPEHRLVFSQLSMFVGRNWVLSFVDDAEDYCETVRQRIRTSRGIVRQHAVDHLMYALLDTVIDGYFPVLEDFGEYLEFIQDETLLRQQPQALVAIQRAKHELLNLRRAVWPLREILNVLMRDDNDNLTAPVKHYLRDCYDHVVMMIDTVETYREMASDLMDAYMSAVSNRLNSVMKILTVIATIFMPLTFVAGVYGMNFHTDVSRWNMPELTWAYGYPAFWVAMFLTVAGMFLYFRRLGWIGAPDMPSVDDDPERCAVLRQRLLQSAGPRRKQP